MAQPSEDELARQSQQAKSLMGEGRFAEAVPIYEALTRALPANPGLRLNLGLALQMSGRHADAIPEFERVLKAEPSALPALISLGVAHLELNQPAKAIPPLEKAVSLDASNPNVRGMLAAALLSQNRFREAATHYRRLTTLTPDDPKAWHGLGRTYEALAQASFEQLDKTGQGSAEWLTLVGDSRLERRQFRSAFFFYQQALEKNPALPGVHASMAELYRRTGHPEWAAVEDRKAAAQAQKVNCVQQKQACAFAAGRHLEAATGPSMFWRIRAYNELALDAFKKLGRLPASLELHALKAEILTNHHQFMEAVQEWRAAQKLAPGEPRIDAELGMALYRASDYASAIPVLDGVLKKVGDISELVFMLGDSYLRSERPEEALPLLERAVKLNAALLPARASLGLALMRLERPVEAVTHLAAALDLDDDGNLHYQLAQAQQRAGNAEEAKKLLVKYQQIRQRAQQEQERLEQVSEITAPAAP
jgi:tetratricopeptide (TPR) repeat protein